MCREFPEFVRTQVKEQEAKVRVWGNRKSKLSDGIQQWGVQKPHLWGQAYAGLNLILASSWLGL